MIHPNFTFSLFLPTLNISCVQREGLKSLNFVRPVLEDPHFSPADFIFLIYLHTSTFKISCIVLKSLDFEGQFGVETPIVAPPVFVRFSLFLIFTHSENLTHLALNSLKVQNFGGPD